MTPSASGSDRGPRARRRHGAAAARVLPPPAAQAKARVAELVGAGELTPVRVDGLPQQMYLWPAARVPARVQARALLSPFDSLIWERDPHPATLRLPLPDRPLHPAAKRTHGYYVLPFLLGDRLVARVDLRADRRQSALLVQAAHAEPDVRGADVAAELAAELRLLAGWLELDRVAVNRLGDLGPALAGAVSAAG